MAIERRVNESGDVIIVAPAVSIQSTLGELTLTWTNTKVCTFGDSEFNHVEYTHEDRRQRMAMQVAESFVVQLIQLDFPHDHRPLPDEATEGWYYARQAELLAEELEAFDE